jgi:hypothetical protein
MISLFGDGVDGAAVRFSQTLLLSSQSKKTKLDLREQLIAGRVELTTAALMTSESVKKIESVARLEHQRGSSETARLAADAGRDFSESETSQTFTVLVDVYRKTARNAALTKAVCRSEAAMADRLQQLKQDLGSY